MTVAESRNNPAVPAVPPGTRVARPQDFRVELKSLPTWVRPEVIYWYATWLKIRDACAGERQIKDLHTYYLPALDGMDDGEYAAFADRATYYNFSSRTVSSMSGSIFRRRPLVDNVPDWLQSRMETIAKDRTDFVTFASGATEEVVKLGRIGVLLDLPSVATTTPRPYLASYTAENILDWDEGEDTDGRAVPVRIVLRETNDGRNIATDARKAYVRYRELMLVPDPLAEGKMIYQQFVYAAVNADAQMSVAFRSDPITPLMRGRPLDYIPFQMFGPHLSSMTVEKPPMEDIAFLNLSHYRSYAYLEHGRFFVGFPIYTAEEPQQGGDVDYQIGSSRVWIVPAGGSAKILEMNGQGLKFLENALNQKEMQAVSIGSKMLGAGGSNMPAKGADQLILEERNEQSILLKITRQLDKGFTTILRWWAQWNGLDAEDAAKIQVTFNKDFLFAGISARELRAVHAMYKDGVVPVQVLHYYLKKGDVVPDWMTVTDFEAYLNESASFPGQPDAAARIDKNYQSRQQQLTHEEKLAGIDIQQQEIDLQEAQQEQAAATAKVAAATAKITATAQAHAIKAGAGQPKAPGGGGAPPPGGPQPVPKVAPPAVPMPGVKPSGKA
jgi:uncharacterized protein DUF4055